MLIRLLILAVLWFAIFRFVGRVLRYLASAGTASRATPRPSPRSDDTEARRRTEGTPRQGRVEVIDVEYEDLTPRSGG